MADGRLILIAGALLAVGLGASLAAGRLRMPALVLFLGAGMAIGSDGLGWIHFDDYRLAQSIGVVALGLILFEGGLSAGFSEIRPVLGPGISLAVIGTMVTAVVSGLAASWLFGLSTVEGLLLGSILASTDSAAIFAVLRGSTLRRRLARTLEAEAGLNDPVAVVLVIGFVSWLTNPHYRAGHLIWDFVTELGIGLCAGVGVGLLAALALRRTRLASAGLYPVASLAVAALAYGSASVLGGSGFLAVYLAGLALGSGKVPAKRTMATFHQGLGWVAQVVLFLSLGLLVFPSQLGDVALEGSALALIVVLVARPLGAVLATVGAGFDWGERVALGWAGLRGAVPMVLATFPVLKGVAHSHEFFNIVFFAVLLSTVLQGSTFEPLAKALGVTTSEAALPRSLADVGAVRRLGAEVIEHVVRRGDAIDGARVRQLGLPREALVNIVVRGEQAIPPRGSTQIEAGDRLHLLVRQEAAVELGRLLEVWRSGPIDLPARRPPTAASSHSPLTSGRWPPGQDAGHPLTVAGTPVHEQLRTRRDGVAGALVTLQDGRFAFTGPTYAAGTLRHVRDAAGRRLQRATGDSERAWWRDVVGALAAPENSS
ncbi:MAG: potassium/proton antiporter [Solirubrobacteraceae bacterium]|nr:potassium/proton antiporter [Solirubrobacteraceae bacterium]